MGEKKVTVMRLKVDLQCCKCRKKVKRILCKIPQIQDQIYNEKENIVMIKVVCCSPEKIMEKIRCKGGESIKSIEIVPPPPPPPQPKQPEKEKPKKEPDIKADGPDKPPRPIGPKEPQKSKGPEKPKEPPPKPADPPPNAQPKPPEPAPLPICVPCMPATGYPPPYPQCCRDCAEGRRGGPCYCGPLRVICYDGYYGRPVYDSWGGGCDRGYYRSRCSDYICEENPNAACTIM